MFSGKGRLRMMGSGAPAPDRRSARAERPPPARGSGTAGLRAHPGDRWAATMNAILVLVALAAPPGTLAASGASAPYGAPAPSTAADPSRAAGCGDLLARLSEGRSLDPAALLGLGGDCEARPCIHLARIVYEKVLKLDETAVASRDRCEAGFRLARIEIDRKRHERGFTLLREALARCPDHAEARALLEKAESVQTREQVASVAMGDELFEKGDFKKAVASYEKALAITPEGTTEAAYVPRSVVLSKLSRCRDRLDDIEYRKEFLPKVRSIAPCPECSREKKKGFIDCTNCGGDGELIVKRRIRVGTTFQTVDVPITCSVCKGYGYRGCRCGALGYVSDAITSKERSALRDLVSKVASPRLFALPFGDAVKGVEKTLLDVEEGAALNFFRAIDPDYSLSKKLRGTITTVPPDAPSSALAAGEWRGITKDQRAKVNFLLNYACEYADHIQHFDMLRGSRGPSMSGFKGSAAWDGNIMTPEILSAFPDERRTGWIAVEGMLSGSKVGAPGEHKGYLEIAGETPDHTVRFFAWLPSARPRIERLADIDWAGSVRELTRSYPFEIWEKLAAAPKDHRVRLVGRFLRDRFSYPRNWFEVWDFQVGLSRSQETILRALGEPVDIELPGLELRQIAEVFRDWFDLDVGLQGVDASRRITASAVECPKGLLVDAIAREALGADWYYRDGRATILGGGTNPIARDMQAAIERLRGRPPSSEATRVSASLEGGASALEGGSSVARGSARILLPGDPAGLRVAARDAIRAMDYGEADRALEALLLATEAPREREAIERLSAKLRIFGELTRKTPVSSLANAPELTELIYRKGSDEFVQKTVILTKAKDDQGKEVWTVQEAYGASFRIRPESVRGQKPVSGTEWHRRKRAELAAKEAECAEARSEEQVPKLFLMALFAKTNELNDLGTAFLDRAVKAPGFSTFLDRFFPMRSGELGALWRAATGSGPQVALGDAGTSGRADVQPPPEAAPPAAVPTEPVTPLPEGLSDAELVARAREYARDGKACTQEILKGDGAAGWRRRAIQSYEQAERAMDRILERNPGDETARRLKHDFGSMLATLQKDMGFFD